MKPLPKEVATAAKRFPLVGGFGYAFDHPSEVPAGDTDWHETPSNTPEEVPSGEQEL